MIDVNWTTLVEQVGVLTLQELQSMIIPGRTTHCSTQPLLVCCHHSLLQSFGEDSVMCVVHKPLFCGKASPGPELAATPAFLKASRLEL